MDFYRKILLTFLIGLLSFVAAHKIYAQEANVSTLVQQAQKAGIKPEALTDLQNRAREHGVNNQQLGMIIKTAISMSDEGLPADVAIQKSLEGFSKGIPVNRIISVVQREHTSLGQAAKIVDPWMKNQQIQDMMDRSNRRMPEKTFRNELTKAASKSLMQNISSEDVNGVLSQISDKSVLSKAGPADIVAAIGIIPDLPSSAGPKASANFVVRALKGGFKANDLQKLPSAVKMAQQRSELPAASVLEGVAGQMKKGVPARQIIQNLFNGKVGGGPPGHRPKGLGPNSNHGNAGQNSNHGNGGGQSNHGHSNGS